MLLQTLLKVVEFKPESSSNLGFLGGSSGDGGKERSEGMVQGHTDLGLPFPLQMEQLCA